MGFKDFFVRLFKKDIHDNETQLLTILNDTSIVPYESNKEDLYDNGFIKICNIGGNVVNRLPEIMGLTWLNGSYCIRLPKKYSINDLMKLTKNGELTTVLKEGGKGKIKGMASLVSNQPKAITIGLFTTLSVITSQYFLTEINNNIIKIKRKLDSIDFFLRLDKQCEMYSEIEFIQEIDRDYEIISENSIYKQSVLSNILNVKNKANSNIKFYSAMIQKHFSNINIKRDKENDISNNLISINDNISNLKFSTMIYMCSCIFQIIYSDNIDNTDYINNIISDMKEKQNLFEGILDNSLKEYERDKSKIKERKKFGLIKTMSRYNPDKYFEKSIIEEDKSDFCNNFIETINKIKMLNCNSKEFIICDEELYMRSDELL